MRRWEGRLEGEDLSDPLEIAGGSQPEQAVCCKAGKETSDSMCRS